MTEKVNPWEQLAQAWHRDPWELEDELDQTGIYLKQSTIHVRANEEDNKVTPEDVIKYYRYDARNISSGMRSLAGISGDWRPINELAGICLDIYKVLKRPELERIARRYGMTLRT